MIDNNLVLGFGIVAIALWIPLAFMALKRDLMIFQQNSYRPERYARWAQTNGESTTIARCCYLFAAFLLMVKMVPLMISCVVASVIAAWNLAILLRMKYKKPLVFTPRAKRIMGVACLISIVLVAGGWFIAGIRGATAVAYLQLFASALIMLLANLILKPVEKTITRKYYNEAKNILLWRCVYCSDCYRICIVYSMRFVEYLVADDCSLLVIVSKEVTGRIVAAVMVIILIIAAGIYVIGYFFICESAEYLTIVKYAIKSSK